ncbi:isopentenyl-diphosphate Delta-isomerase [Paractinoplanes globisporus]|uniref:Isopentenyl-diphosphate Delta-isomerase n=1 Tax=Paractinoplanes globisporus TaxID=113565 RepID=A0ABW6WQS6_9ACTN|nr:isopentenyl-diphosphate Delta-isomerase [Actinoplanes globisporus]
MSHRESHAVELVDISGKSVGAATVSEAHQAPGMLHRAFSVFVRDPSTGQVLLQQRAAVKTRFPLRWANTCCGHPLPAEDVAVAARRRMAEELGLPEMALTPIGVYTYRAVDPAGGRVEHEYDHVLLGDLPAGARVVPDPAEVAALRWISVPALLESLASDPAPYAPWLAGVTARLAEHLSRPLVPPVPSVPRPNAGRFEVSPPGGDLSDDAPERWPGGR